ncbi:MAG: ABC transporter substrate-binding protein [Nocardioidaceae bacterium]|nr:ABC transporter substrate-binding protein [Nocardioidaceae bacterium]
MAPRTDLTQPSRRGFLKAAGAGLGLMVAGPTLLSACGDGGGSAGGGARVSHQLGWLKLTQFGGFFAADNKGYYKDEGISTAFTAGGPNILAWQSVATGRATVGDDDNTNVLVAMAKGEPLVIYGAIFQTSPFAILSKPDKPINSVEDFAGKTIAVSDASKQQFQALVKDAGLKASDVKFIPAGPDPTQLVTGQCDGFSGYATSQAVALQEQGVDVHTTYLEQLGILSYGNVLVTTKKNLDSQSERLTKFLRATIKGYEYMNANPDEIGKLVATKYGPSGLKSSTEIATAKFQKNLIESPKGVLQVDPAKMQTIIDGLVKVGTLPKQLDAADVVTTEILDAAYGGKTTLLS